MEKYVSDLKNEKKAIEELQGKHCPLTLSLISREIEKCELRRVHVSGSERAIEFLPPPLSLSLGIDGSSTAPPDVARPTAAFGFGNIGSSTSKIAPAVPGNPIPSFLGGGERAIEFHPPPPDLSLSLGIAGSSTSKIAPDVPGNRIPPFLEMGGGGAADGISSTGVVMGGITGSSASNIAGQSILNMGGPAVAVGDPFLNRAKRDCHIEEPKPKKAKLIWTQALHDMFVRHITRLGGPRVAVPRTILEGMLSEGANVTKEEIKSHLQKYRQEIQAQAQAQAQAPAPAPDPDPAPAPAPAPAPQ